MSDGASYKLIVFKNCPHFLKFESQSQNSPPPGSFLSQVNLTPIQNLHSVSVLQLTRNLIYSEALHVRSSLNDFRIFLFISYVVSSAFNYIQTDQQKIKFFKHKYILVLQTEIYFSFKTFICFLSKISNKVVKYE
jgi:hypothetical protein